MTPSPAPATKYTEGKDCVNDWKNWGNKHVKRILSSDMIKNKDTLYLSDL